MWKEKRASTRHIIELPIKYRILPESPERRSETQNFSDGGLLFLASERFAIGTLLELTVPTKDKVFMVEGRVAHVIEDERDGFFRMGVRFLRPQSLFLVKMAEQIHQIDLYRKTLSKKEGHDISEEEAAHRWIEEHSKAFSKFYK